MGYVAIRNENRMPIQPSENRSPGGPLARCGPALTSGGSATGQQRIKHAGGISLAAVLGGTLLRWGRGSHDTSPRRVALRP